LSLVADFRVTCPEARFSVNFNRLGFHPGFGLSLTLPRLIGVQQASLLLYTGRRIDGETAVRIGLADELVPADQVLARAHALATEIAISAPLAVESTRAALREGLADAIYAANQKELAIQLTQFPTEDFAKAWQPWPNAVRRTSVVADTHERIYVTVSTKTDVGPLSGVRVLDLSAVVLGPMGTQVLADMGADVIKIESPEGDLMRANGVVEVPGMSSIFLALNRNKRSVVLDLKTEAGRAALRRLIPTVDVLVHNMRVSAIERLGFGYDAVRAESRDRLLRRHRFRPGWPGSREARVRRHHPGRLRIRRRRVDQHRRARLSAEPDRRQDHRSGGGQCGAAVPSRAAWPWPVRRGADAGNDGRVRAHRAYGWPDLSGLQTKAGCARLLEGGRKPVRTKDG
jgi:hypothetical protein